MLLWEIAASLDLPVFPCREDKKPACVHGFKDATRDRNKIRELFAFSSDAALIGVPTGETSGFDVLDLDTSRHPEALAWMRSQTFPPTRVHKTKSGGYHLLFNHHPSLRSWTARPVMGVDGRADGGYIVHWPSCGLSSNTRQILDWPAEILSICKPKPAPKQAATSVGPLNNAKFDGVVRRIANAVNGERNDVLFWGACRFSEWIDLGDLPRSVGEAVLMSCGRQIGLPDIETSKTIASAFNGARRGDSETA